MFDNSSFLMPSTVYNANFYSASNEMFSNHSSRYSHKYGEQNTQRNNTGAFSHVKLFLKPEKCNKHRE
jgi:hypothetical protein